MGKLQWNKAFAFEQAADDEDLVRELLEIFKTTYASDCHQIEKGISGNNPEIIASAAHSIKGASASLGFEGITSIARAIESDSRQGNIEQAKQSIATLLEMIAELDNIL